MDFMPVVYISILIFSAIVILITLVTLPNTGDERKRLIRTKAQSYAFTIIVAVLLFDAARELYSIFTADSHFDGYSSFTLLGSASFIYLCALLYFRRRYGY
ncbi:hypothetical protein CR205_13850 [Alteribacter lacisalsi]|uniref:DUF2178 domain-containing protein n=1 Tax=Alteribacter lacisalsi TaxID=2045244 RepID=A0A2W0H6L8_9BACI|nr:hypothetical protein [Alteribacter lacisalsi]PYZ96767.1 hypothetical protein CR205_13850 [Alteribacter lacisalsi]